MGLETLTLEKIDHISGSVQLIGSKSLTNRALLLSALAHGSTKLSNILRSDDSQVMLSSLEKLGVVIHNDSPTEVTIEGLGGLFNTQDQGIIELFLGNAGTAMRPLAAALALSKGTYKLTGESRMYERPIGILVDALRALGAHIEYLGTEGYPPLLITGRQAMSTKSSYELEVLGNTSSQFISALLMIGALLDHPLELKVKGELISKPYVTLTCELLKRFGITIENHDFKSFTIKPQDLVSPGSYLVEGDASGATYFLAAAAIKGSVKVYGVGKDSIQGDAKFIEVLARMGAQVEVGADYLAVSAAQELKGISIDMNDMPDAAMTLVPMALFTKEPITILNIESWRVKETDRISALATQMRKLGCQVQEGQDFIKVWAHGVDYEAQLGKVVAFDTYNDHRMAMAMSLAALDRTVIINDPKCCAKTFPDYFERLAQVSMH